MFSKNSVRAAIAVIACAFTFSLASHAEVSAGSKSARALITQKIDVRNTVTLDKDVRLDLRNHADLGAVEDTMPVTHMKLVLKQSDEQKLALENLLARQHQKGTPEYHQWLTPQEFGEAFGGSSADVAKITEWLESQGFKVNGVANGGRIVDFSGDARTVREALGVNLHYFQQMGAKRYANINAPHIPAALAPVVGGIFGLNRFSAKPMHTDPKLLTYSESAQHFVPVEVTGAKPAVRAIPDTVLSGNQYEGGQDFYTIYNESGLLTQASPINGTGATVAVIEQSDIAYGTVNGTTGVATGGDVVSFRTLFKVPGTLTMKVFHGFGADTCTDPGIIADEEEASLDAEWANATAPSATLIFMSCDENIDNGIFSSLFALVDNNLGDSMSMSYGESELYETAGDSTYQFLDAEYGQAAAQGQTIAVSTGDSGSDVKDQNQTAAVSGISVSVLSDSPYVTAAGGTDFQDEYDQLEGSTTSKISTYWSTSQTVAGGFKTAKSYVPETAWNSSCAGSLTARLEGYTGAALPNDCDGAGSSFLANVIGGSGGFSTVYSAPAYQTGTSGFSGTHRAQPDVALFASSGWWSHALLFCDQTDSGQTNCQSGIFSAGGTSFVAPQLAGVFGLLRQKTAGRVGSVNPVLYSLARSQYGTATNCSANGQTANTGLTTGLPASTCTFRDVTTGNNDVGCSAGALSCFVNAGHTAGVLSTTGAASLTIAYPSTVAYDEATGLGSLNIANLVNNYAGAITTNTVVAASPTVIAENKSTTLTATVTENSSFPLPVGGTVTFKEGATTLGTCALVSGTCSLTVTGATLGVGNDSVTASFGGTGSYPASVSTILTVTVGNLVFTSVSHNFGQVAVGTTASTYGVQMTNLSSSAFPFSLTLGGVVQPNTATASPFTQQNNCGASLAAGASCEIVFSFKPTASGPVSTTWSVASTAADFFAPSNGGTLQGSGTTQGGVSLTTAGHNFGTVTVGTTSATYGTELSNSTATAETISVIGGSAPFHMVTNCGTTLAAGASCELEFTYQPETTGTSSGTVPFSGSPTVITSGGAPLPNGGITLTGTGVNP
jgi:hypothetical protein